MAVEKGKVLAAIELKFKGKSLSKNFKDSIATKWAAKIETDEEIDGYIEDREDVILEASTEADRRATQATAKAKADAAAAVTGKAEPEPGKTDDPAALPEGTPEWMKPVLGALQTLTQKVSAFEQQKQADSLTDRFTKDERLKGIPAPLIKRSIPQKEEDYEASVTSLVDDWKPIAEQHKLGAFGQDAPTGGNKGAAGSKEATKEELDAIMPNLLN